MVKTLSVVIPAYNEQANIASCVTQVSRVLTRLRLEKYEIIVVDDGSKDDTGKIVKQLIKKIPHLRLITNNPNRGYGGALKAGFVASRYEFIAFFPADNQFDFSEIRLLIATQQSANADIVSGIRVGGGVDPLYRRLNRWGWNTVVRALFGYLATDIDCGFKLFRASILKHAYLPAERGAMIDTQLFASARAHGFTVAETPLTHLPRLAGKSTGANPRVILQSFIDLFTYWFRLKREILVERGLAVFQWELLALLLILGIAAFSRLYDIRSYATFLGDEGRDARVMRDIITGKNFPLLGPGTSIGGMYLGPLYYYMTAPSLALFRDPVGPAVQTALIGVVVVALLWWVGRQWFGRLPALACSLFMAISPTLIIYSRSSWNPNVMPFFALLAIYSIWKVYRYQYWRWLPVAATSLAFALNSHYLGLLLLPPALLFVLLSSRSARDARPNLVFSALIFFLFMSPLLIFDLRYGFQNSKSILKFFTHREQTVSFRFYAALPRLPETFNQAVYTTLAAKSQTAAPFVSASLFLAAVVCLTKATANRKDLAFLLVWLLIGLSGFSLYKQHIYDHYFGFLFPQILLLFGFALKLAGQNFLLRPVALVGSAALILINLQSHPLRYPPNRQIQRVYDITQDLLRRSRGQPFNLALISENNYDASYRYFLEELNAPLYTIHERITDQLFVICEKRDCQPLGHSQWEIAAFGWAKIDSSWRYPDGIQGFRLIHAKP